MALRTAKGVKWVVFAHRCEERLVARGQRQGTAWKEAVRLALGTNGARTAAFE
jgi:hypothetical protein